MRTGTRPLPLRPRHTAGAAADSRRILAFDAATGQILWQTGSEVEDVVHLLGVAGDRLIASGGGSTGSA